MKKEMLELIRLVSQGQFGKILDHVRSSGITNINHNYPSYNPILYCACTALNKKARDVRLNTVKELLKYPELIIDFKSLSFIKKQVDRGDAGWIVILNTILDNLKQGKNQIQVDIVPKLTELSEMDTKWEEILNVVEPIIDRM